MAKTTNQIVCKWENNLKKKVITVKQKKRLAKLKNGEILVKNLYVPVHGSFWLSSSEKPAHPRIKEFLNKNSFVFGNGGVSKIIAKHVSVDDVEIGDYVAVFGHYPCNNYDCYPCKVLHRYTECQYGQGKIIGHGKDSYDGTFSEYTILPKYSYELCFKKKEKPSNKELMPFMYSFLLADVRNALTRIPELYKNNRMVLFGAGQSGSLAAYLFSNSSPDNKIFVIDNDISKIKNLKKNIASNIDYFLISKKISDELSKKIPSYDFAELINETIDKISRKLNNFFSYKNLGLLMDCSSSNTSPLWSNNKILKENTFVIPFGFASNMVLLDEITIQKSGLTIMMSRGVGNQRNRKETIELIKRSKGKFIANLFLKKAIKVRGINNMLNKISKRKLYENKLLILSFQNEH